MWKWSDVEDEDYMDVHSEDSDNEQNISNEDALDMNAEHFSGKDKESKWRKTPLRRQTR